MGCVNWRKDSCVTARIYGFSENFHREEVRGLADMLIPPARPASINSADHDKSRFYELRQGRVNSLSSLEIYRLRPISYERARPFATRLTKPRHLSIRNQAVLEVFFARNNNTNMSLVNLAAVCSHLNNATKARLGLTSIPNSNLHLKLCQALQNSGYISSVVRGGPTPPPMHPILGYPTANDEIEGVEPITRDNVASRRLWLGLKYWQNESVLGKVQMVSKPTRRINLNVEELRRVVRGHEANHVDGLRSPGESLYLSTDRGVLEARECVEKKLGGLVLCRVL